MHIGIVLDKIYTSSKHEELDTKSNWNPFLFPMFSDYYNYTPSTALKNTIKIQALAVKN